MSARAVIAVVAAAVILGCGRASWPDPPAVDDAEYRRKYEEWRSSQQQTAEYAMRIVGIWPLAEGDTAFGSDASLPVVLPSRAAPPQAGVLRNAANTITVIPAAGAPLMADGSLLVGPTELQGPLELGSISLEVVDMGEPSSGRRFVMAWDAQHPEAQDLPPVDVYPVDRRWRVAARFEAFDTSRPVRVPDVRGGFMDFAAPGELVFQLDGEQMRLTAFGESGSDEFFVMFKDATNRTTTYGGYRILLPRAARDGEWTVLDFNLAFNPPCAYSSFTTCPLPPPENRLDVAVTAGEKRYPVGHGFVVP